MVSLGVDPLQAGLFSGAMAGIVGILLLALNFFYLSVRAAIRHNSASRVRIQVKSLA